MKRCGTSPVVVATTVAVIAVVGVVAMDLGIGPLSIAGTDKDVFFDTGDGCTYTQGATDEYTVTGCTKTGRVAASGRIGFYVADDAPVNSNRIRSTESWHVQWTQQYVEHDLGIDPATVTWECGTNDGMVEVCSTDPAVLQQLKDAYGAIDLTEKQGVRFQPPQAMYDDIAARSTCSVDLTVDAGGQTVRATEQGAVKLPNNGNAVVCSVGMGGHDTWDTLERMEPSFTLKTVSPTETTSGSGTESGTTVSDPVTTDRGFIAQVWAAIVETLGVFGVY